MAQQGGVAGDEMMSRAEEPMKHSTDIPLSSTISHVGYDDETNELSITFKHGGEHLYRGVSPEEHKSLIEAPSTGQHFHTHIRTQYTGAKQVSLSVEKAS
jgi:hypothetical protein